LEIGIPPLEFGDLYGDIDGGIKNVEQGEIAPIEIPKAIKYHSKACELKYDSLSCYPLNELKNRQASDRNSSRSDASATIKRKLKAKPNATSLNQRKRKRDRRQFKRA
jgi:hypothetical protein